MACRVLTFRSRVWHNVLCRVLCVKVSFLALLCVVCCVLPCFVCRVVFCVITFASSRASSCAASLRSPPRRVAAWRVVPCRGASLPPFPPQPLLICGGAATKDLAARDGWPQRCPYFGAAPPAGNADGGVQGRQSCLSGWLEGWLAVWLSW